MAAGPGLFPGHVILEPGQDISDAGGEGGIEQADTELVIGQLMEDGDGVVVQVLPGARRQLVEKLLGIMVPGPPQVVRQAIQALGQCFDIHHGQRFTIHANGQTIPRRSLMAIS